jgi:hypothetical protein
MKFSLLLLGSVFFISSVAQVPVSSGVMGAKEYSKEIALFKAKQFVIETVLGVSGEVFEFEIDPLAAASSGELTSLVYRCIDKGKEGLVFGFYGDYWNPAGVVYKGFAFKDIPKDRALLLLDTLQKTIDAYSKFLGDDRDNNNLYFKAEDMTFLIFYSGLGLKIRVFWHEFDSEWDIVAFRRTKRRLLNKLNGD